MSREQIRPQPPESSDEAPSPEAPGDLFATFSFEWNPDTDLISRSPECSAILGPEPSPTQMTGRELLARIHPDDRPGFETILRGLNPSHPTYRTSYRYLTPNGRELVLEEHGRAMFDTRGRQFYLLGITADVTARKRAEEALRQSEKRLRLALAAARGGTWCLNPETKDCLASDEVCRLMGLPAKDSLDLPDILGQIHPEDRPDVEARLDRAMRERVPYRVEFRVPLPGGRVRWLAAQGEMCAQTGRDRRLLGLVQDITKRKRSEEALRESDRRKDEFLATLSHELRTPLTPIRNAVGLMRLTDQDDPQLRQTLEIIDRQSAHMVRLLDDLLDVSRIALGKLELRRETVTLSDVILQALETSRPRAEDRKQHLEAALPPRTVRLACDPVRLAQVFSNLLDNATKYTAEGGEIRLESKIEDGEAVIIVSDTGRGIDPNELPRLFDTFAQGQQDSSLPRRGLGLGLSIVRRLVKMHGGSVDAESAGAGTGSRFTVRLPLAQVPDRQPQEEDPPGSAPQILRVLVVDDDPDIAASTGMLLEALGHQVDLAADGEEAIRQARLGHHRLILLDIGLKNSTGFDVARRLRQLPHGSGMHIAAVTGDDDASTRAKARAAGIDRHLLKPLDLDELQDLVRSVPT